MIFCSIANHLCMALPFIMCSIVKQCWSVGYVIVCHFVGSIKFEIKRFDYILICIGNVLLN